MAQSPATCFRWKFSTTAPQTRAQTRRNGGINRLVDDFTGWRFFSIPFAYFQRRTDWQPSGAPNDGLALTEVHGYAFFFIPRRRQSAYQLYRSGDAWQR